MELKIYDRSNTSYRLESERAIRVNKKSNKIYFSKAAAAFQAQRKIVELFLPKEDGRLTRKIAFGILEKSRIILKTLLKLFKAQAPFFVKVRD